MNKSKEEWAQAYFEFVESETALFDKLRHEAAERVMAWHKENCPSAADGCEYYFTKKYAGDFKAMLRSKEALKAMGDLIN